MKNNNKDWGELKKKISETLVKYSMPTRQVAINEILSHFSLRLQEIAKELEGKKEKEPYLKEVGKTIDERKIEAFAKGVMRGFNIGIDTALSTLGVDLLDNK